MIRHLRKRKADGAWLCGGCGWLIDNQREPWRSTCPQCAVSPPWQPVMIGNAIEKGLSAIGITKERVAKVLGNPSGGCGCSSRQRAVNQAGAAVQIAARNAALQFKRFAIGD